MPPKCLTPTDYDTIASIVPECETCYALQEALVISKSENDTLKETVYGLKKQLLAEKERHGEEMKKYKRDLGELVGL